MLWTFKMSASRRQCTRAWLTPDAKRIDVDLTTRHRVPHPPLSGLNDWDRLLIEAYQCPRGFYLFCGLVPTDARFRGPAAPSSPGNIRLGTVAY